ncbi:hypothetical protein TNCV_4598951 [Trichonephila clavipes]|nr:hypothetical protein TNCV_4598951 [Trichonephila clavipes]
MSKHRYIQKTDCLVRFVGLWNPSSKNDEGHNGTVNGDWYRAMITNFFIPELNNHDVQSCGSNKTAQHVTQLVPQSIY